MNPVTASTPTWASTGPADRRPRIAHHDANGRRYPAPFRMRMRVAQAG